MEKNSLVLNKFPTEHFQGILTYRSHTYMFNPYMTVSGWMEFLSWWGKMFQGSSFNYMFTGVDFQSDDPHNEWGQVVVVDFYWNWKEWSDLLCWLMHWNYCWAWIVTRLLMTWKKPSLWQKCSPNLEFYFFYLEIWLFAFCVLIVALFDNILMNKFESEGDS